MKTPRIDLKSGLFHGRPIYVVAILVLLAALVVSVLASVTFGSVPLSVGEVYGVILHKLLGVGNAQVFGSGKLYDIVWFIRLPRVIMAVGVGMYLCSIIATAMILIILAAFQIYESRARIGQENRMVKITVEGVIDDITPYREILNAHSVHLSTYYINYDYAQNRTELNMAVLAPSHRNYLPMFNALRTIRPTLSLTLTATA